MWLSRLRRSCDECAGIWAANGDVFRERNVGQHHALGQQQKTLVTAPPHWRGIAFAYPDLGEEIQEWSKKIFYSNWSALDCLWLRSFWFWSLYSAMLSRNGYCQRDWFAAHWAIYWVRFALCYRNISDSMIECRDGKIGIWWRRWWIGCGLFVAES